MDVLKFSQESLEKLKYIYLQKLAHKHNIKKRWAKKDELVKSLMAVKEKLLVNTETQDNQVNEEIEWKDGASFIGTTHNAENANFDAELCRGTFTIDKIKDPRATYDLTGAINNILPDLDASPSWQTYDIPKHYFVDSPIVARPVIHLPKKVKPASGTVVKMLTIPHSPVGPRVPSIRGGATAGKKSIHHLSSKSISIKKAKAGSPLKLGTTAAGIARNIRPVHSSSALSAQFNGQVIQTATKKTSDVKRTVITAKIVERIQSIPTVQPQIPSSLRRKSKSDDPAVRRKLSTSNASTFLTPPARSQNTRGKTAVSKIPDFAKMHEKQFQKMDSLDEYINKKAERVRKLFGTPLLQRPIETSLQPENILKGLKDETKRSRPSTTPSKENIENARKIINRNPNLRAQTDVKDKNRSHIHGIRTNKRFELQMKFRNL